MEYAAPKHPLHALKRLSTRAAAALALTAERLARPVADPARPVRQVLILHFILPLGACVAMTPVFEALHLQGKRVIVATRGPVLDLLRHSPFVDHLLEVADPITNLRSAVRSLRAQLQSRGLQPDCVLTGSFDQRTRIALLAAFASNAWRGGYTIVEGIYQKPIAYRSAQSRIANNLRLGELVAGPAASTQPPEPKVFFTQHDLAQAERLLAPLRQSGKPILIAVSQTGRGHYGWWRTDRWQQTLTYARQALGFAIAHVGTQAEAPALETLRQVSGGISLAGQTPLPVLAAVLTLADLVVSVDTGTMHMARAAQVPLVALAPSWQRAVQWMPLGLPHVRVLRGPDIVLPIPDDYQLDEITAAEVCTAIDDLLQLFPPSAQARQTRAQTFLSAKDLLQAN